MTNFAGNAAARLLFYAGDNMVCQLGEREARLMRAGDYLVAQSRVGITLLQVEMENTIMASRAGEYLELQSYSPYGFSPVRHLAPIVQFNGEWRDSLTGNYPLGQGHRSFSSRIGRFVSPDQLSPFGKGGVNAYAYCSGDPVNRIDPSGKINFSKLFRRSQKTGLTKAMRREKLPSFLKKFIKSNQEVENARELFGVGRMYGRVSGTQVREFVPMYDDGGFKSLEVKNLPREMYEHTAYYVKGDLYIEAGNMHDDFKNALKQKGFSLNSISNVKDLSSSSGAKVEEIRSKLSYD
ncbi:RHS repeat-associated core domain-containing protein [Pseudomonas kurunegalensis]|uniref:RHS repeat-associated core domain-containing protein n=1 Tax=Pseudomonas kurunegalensis TaxID=485880 RepID=UPI003558E860